jgi:hypothetical protein
MKQNLERSKVEIYSKVAMMGVAKTMRGKERYE